MKTQPLPLLLLLLLPLTAAILSPPPTCTAAVPASTPTSASNGVCNLGIQLFQQLGAPVTTTTTNTANTSPNAPTTTTTTASNTLISPYSLWTALTLAYIGAEGETESQLGAALGFSSKQGVLNLLTEYEQGLIKKINADPGTSFDSATRLYVDDQFSIARCRDDLKNYLQTLNISTQPQEAAKSINNFVNSTTQGLIGSIIEPSMLDSLTRLVAVSAVYFKGSWLFPFNENYTEPQPFNLLGSEETVMVDMMTVRDALVRMGRSQELNAQVIQIPYASKLVNMTLVVPLDPTADGFRKTLNALSVSNIKSAFSHFEEDFITLKMPKFEVRSEFAEEMKTALEVLGVTDLFSQDRANLTSFAEDLYVKHLVHKTVLRVDEEGSEAAAATGLVFTTKIGKHVRVDRPFIYLIHTSDALLFIGSFMKP